jgi:hypothetical protein
LESHTSRKPNEKKKVPAPKPIGEILLGKRVAYGGYFIDLIKADNKWALFDLATPLDQQMDLENLGCYRRTDHVRAVILFSIKR